jgi:hypothetical protein
MYWTINTFLKTIITHVTGARHTHVTHIRCTKLARNIFKYSWEFRFSQQWIRMWQSSVTLRGVVSYTTDVSEVLTTTIVTNVAQFLWDYKEQYHRRLSSLFQRSAWVTVLHRIHLYRKFLYFLLHSALFIWSVIIFKWSRNFLLLWNEKFRYHIHNKPPLNPIVSNFNKVHIFKH